MHQKKPSQRNPYPPEQLIHLWDNKQIPIEQLCGQLLVWVQRLHVSTQFNERQVENLDGEMADVVARVTTLEEERSGRR